MANTKSAKKAVRKIAKRTARNRDIISSIRTFIKKVEKAVEAKNVKEATENLRIVQSELMIGVKKCLIKKNAASRKISRLSARIKKIVS
jgi:small subunit ribosomal protein S20